jgi:hypothetical protein
MKNRNATDFDPFARHRGLEVRPEPVQTQSIAETKEDSPAGSKAVEAKPPFSHLKTKPKNRSEPERTQKPQPPQLLLNWLRDKWAKPVVSLRDIQVFGPYDIRDRKSAITYAETLERWGWLVPIQANRRDRRMWMLPPARATALPED